MLGASQYNLKRLCVSTWTAIPNGRVGLSVIEAAAREYNDNGN